MSESHADVTPGTQTPTIGRNEPCPCGSGSKYKRCCGKDAAPKLGKPADLQGRMNEMASAGGLPPGFDPSKVDPQAMSEFNRALMRMPRGQLQRLQSIMQRAMSGQDVSREAAELDRLLPPELKKLAAGMGMGMGLPGPGTGTETEAAPAASMSESEARKLVEEAARKGEISQEEAAKLLSGKPGEAGGQKAGGLSGLWKKIKGTAK